MEVRYTFRRPRRDASAANWGRPKARKIAVPAKPLTIREICLARLAEMRRQAVIAQTD